MKEPATGIEAMVCADIAGRQVFGLRKYGVPLIGNRARLRRWVQHAYEESLDLPCYLRRILWQLDKEAARRKKKKSKMKK